MHTFHQLKKISSCHIPSLHFQSHIYDLFVFSSVSFSPILSLFSCWARGYTLRCKYTKTLHHTHTHTHTHTVPHTDSRTHKRHTRKHTAHRAHTHTHTHKHTQHTAHIVTTQTTRRQHGDNPIPSQPQLPCPPLSSAPCPREKKSGQHTVASTTHVIISQ